MGAATSPSATLTSQYATSVFWVTDGFSDFSITGAVNCIDYLSIKLSKAKLGRHIGENFSTNFCRMHVIWR